MVADTEHVFLLSGTGELIEPDDGIMAVGSGGTYALAAARALYPDYALRRARRSWSGASRSPATSASSPTGT